MLATLRGQRRAARPRRATTASADAEALPFADESFDLVLGHAVLHHLPDLRARVRRVPPRAARPAARSPSPASRRATATASPACPSARAARWRPLWRARDGRARGAPSGQRRRRRTRTTRWSARRRPRLRPRRPAPLARGAGFEDVRVRGEELLANWFGWANRSLEATAEPADVPWLWRQYAYRGYLAAAAARPRVLEPRLPPAIFYNLMLAARKPRTWLAGPPSRRRRGRRAEATNASWPRRRPPCHLSTPASSQGVASSRTGVPSAPGSAARRGPRISRRPREALLAVVESVSTAIA